MAALASGIGLVTGYVGAEVAEAAAFERLLWPQRFYSYLSHISFLTNAFLAPKGGSLHQAALQILELFRENGLYRRRCKGYMLDTAFFREKRIVHINRSSGASGE